MILHRLVLRRFLGLPDHAFDFVPGVNVIVGPNEAGKSTLRTAIRTVLYENPATTSSELREKFRSWGSGDPPELELEFELNGTRFRLTKSFTARKVVLVEQATGRMWEQHRLVQERLGDVLGLASDKVFDATAHIAQAELERIHLANIAKELGRIIGGGGEDVTTALRKLETHVRALERGTRQAAREPGLLVTAEARARALREEVADLRRSAADAERAHVELVDLTTRAAAGREALLAKSALLERNREIVQIEDRLAQLKREEAMWEKKVRDIESLTARLGALARDLEQATAQGIPDEEAVREARVLRERVASRTGDLAALNQEGEDVSRLPPAHGRAWGLGVAGGALLLLGLAVLSAVGPLAWILVAAGLAAGLAAGRVAMQSARAEENARTRREERDRRRALIEAELADLGARTDAARIRFGASIEEAEGRLKRYGELAQERRQVAAFLEQLREGSDDEAIAERWRTVRRDVFGLEERLRAPEVASKRLTPLQVQALEREVAELTQDVAQLQRREMKLGIEADRLTTDGESLAAKEEELQEAEERLDQVRRHHQVCREALSGLQQARELAQIPLRTVVETQAGEYLAAATEGRYSRIQMDPESLELSVWSPDAGDWATATEPQLSRGTIDLVYLAARLALVGVLTNGKRPPLLFDDPFITFDDRRREGAMRLLRELSKEYQVFVFTCARHYDRYADRVIDLPERAGGTAFAGPAPTAVPAVQASAPAAPAPAVGPLWEQPSH